MGKVITNYNTITGRNNCLIEQISDYCSCSEVKLKSKSTLFARHLADRRSVYSAVALLSHLKVDHCHHVINMLMFVVRLKYGEKTLHEPRTFQPVRAHVRFVLCVKKNVIRRISLSVDRSTIPSYHIESYTLRAC